MTDVALANMNGAYSIYVHPIEKTHEKHIIKALRKIEGTFLWFFGEKRRRF
jgi:predicted HAD superfamily phosphohydrolase YqeG